MKKPSEIQFNSLLDVVKRFPDEKSCREYLAQARWNDSPVCIHCGYSKKIYSINDGKLYKCAKCRKQFTVRVGTIFEDSALPLQKWFMAIYLITAHKKGISSVQLGKDIEVTQKTAWFMLHRIRYAVRTKEFGKKLTGTVEADETYIGGPGHKHGRGSENKIPVFGMAERDGNIEAETVTRVNRKTLQAVLKERVDSDANMMTDEWKAYNKLDRWFKSHKRVHHNAKEYVRGDAHVNTIESFWSMLKRGIYGIYHHVSRKHLDKYIDEFEFRCNSKHIPDAQRFGLMLNVCSGRMTYENLIARRQL
jgi:transposase-like protein